MNSQYKTDQWTIAPFGTVTVNRTGEFLTCLDATDTFRIRLSDAPETDFEKGITFTSDVPFHKVDLINPTDAPLVVTIAIGRGSVRDARFVVAGAISTREQLEIQPVVYSSGVTIRGSEPSGLDNELVVNPGGFATLVERNPLRQSSITDVAFFGGTDPQLQFYCGTDSFAGKYPLKISTASEIVTVPGGGFCYVKNTGDIAAYLAVHEVVHV
jgi:hypothetical protein